LEGWTYVYAVAGEGEEGAFAVGTEGLGAGAGITGGTRRGEMGEDGVVELRGLAGYGREIGRDPGLSELLVEVAKVGVVLGHVGEHGGKIKTKGAVELAVDETRREDTPAEVYSPVGEGESVVEGGLAAEDLASMGTDPEVVEDQVIAARESAVGKFCDTIPKLIGWSHVWRCEKLTGKAACLMIQKSRGFQVLGWPAPMLWLVYMIEKK
jgi:hypothetical protein